MELNGGVSSVVDESRSGVSRSVLGKHNIHRRLHHLALYIDATILKHET